MSLVSSALMPTSEAWTLYRQLLERNANPEPGDADLLHSVMRSLNRTADQVRRDLAAIRSATEMEDRLAHEKPRLRDALADISRRLDDCRRRRRLANEAFDREMGDLNGEFIGLDIEQSRLSNAESVLNQLRLGHRELFGLPPS